MVHADTHRSWTRRNLLSVAACTVFASAAQVNNQPFAVVAGTVFQENGLSFPGVNVTLTRKASPRGPKQDAKTSNRGEFAFRVPPDALTYIVTASKRGFVPAMVEAVVPGEGRVDVTITLQKES